MVLVSFVSAPHSLPHLNSVCIISSVSVLMECVQMSSWLQLWCSTALYASFGVGGLLDEDRGEEDGERDGGGGATEDVSKFCVKPLSREPR